MQGDGFVIPYEGHVKHGGEDASLGPKERDDLGMMRQLGALQSA